MATEAPGVRGRVALVTGATGEIGGSIARRLVVDGLQVCVAGRRRDRLARLARETGAHAVCFDVTCARATERARLQVEERFGRVDVVVNAAGVFDLARITDTDVALLERNLDVNLKGVFNVTRTFLSPMLAAESGLVINIGSVAGQRAFVGNAAYSASKYGMRGLHEVLVQEVRGTGVRACLIEPGAVNTPIWDPIKPFEDLHLPDRSVMLCPEALADAVGFVVGVGPEVSIPLIQIERA